MGEEDLFLLVEYSRKRGRIILIGARKEEAFLWTKRFGGRNGESLLFLQENRI